MNKDIKDIVRYEVEERIEKILFVLLHRNNLEKFPMTSFSKYLIEDLEECVIEEFEHARF